MPQDKNRMNPNSRKPCHNSFLVSGYSTRISTQSSHSQNTKTKTEHIWTQENWRYISFFCFRLARESEREAAAVALVVEARRAAAARIQQLQARIDAARQKRDASKRKQFAQLQEQMETDLQVKWLNSYTKFIKRQGWEVSDFLSGFQAFCAQKLGSWDQPKF